MALGRKFFYWTLLGFFSLVLIVAAFGLLELIFRQNEKHGWFHPIYFESSPPKPSCDLSQVDLSYLKDLVVGEVHPDFSDPASYDDQFSDLNCREWKDALFPYWNGCPDSSTKVIVRSQRAHRVIVESTARFDHQSRRRIPSADETQNRFLMFLGCSYTWGFDVNDDETFAEHVTKNFGRPMNAYNLGMPGWAPNYSLRLLQNQDDPRLKGIHGTSGIVIYTFIDDQVRRVLTTLTWTHSASVTPDYTLENGHLIYNGTSLEAHPYLDPFLRFLASSALLSFFNFDWPPIQNRHLELIAQIFEEMKNQTKRFGVQHFYVAIYPNAWVYGPRLIPLLKKHNIEVLDFTGVNFKTLLKGREYINGDYHPSALAHRVYGDLLLNELHKREEKKTE